MKLLNQKQPAIEKPATKTAQDLLLTSKPLIASIKKFKICHINESCHIGGVFGTLNELIQISNLLDIQTDWFQISGGKQYVHLTGKIHHSLQGKTQNISETEWKLFFNNSLLPKTFGTYDFVIIHDHQPFSLAKQIKQLYPDTKVIWHCHLDTSTPKTSVIERMTPLFSYYDLAIYSSSEFSSVSSLPSVVIPPGISQYSLKNKPISQREIRKVLSEHNLSATTPLILQVSRIDPWKRPIQVLEVYKKIQKQIQDLQLVFLAELDENDVEAKAILSKMLPDINRLPNVKLLTNVKKNDITVNALQRHATIIVQYSKREGFGQTVAEAMIKNKIVIGGGAIGIKNQIQDGFNGYLANNERELFSKTLHVLNNTNKLNSIKLNAKASVISRFTLDRLLRDYLILFQNLS
ncbi:glycosyltransferase [Pseudomonadota bacterium]